MTKDEDEAFVPDVIRQISSAIPEPQDTSIDVSVGMNSPFNRMKYASNEEENVWPSPISGSPVSGITDDTTPAVCPKYETYFGSPVDSQTPQTPFPFSRRRLIFSPFTDSETDPVDLTSQPLDYSIRRTQIPFRPWRPFLSTNPTTPQDPRHRIRRRVSPDEPYITPEGPFLYVNHVSSERLILPMEYDVFLDRNGLYVYTTRYNYRYNPL